MNLAFPASSSVIQLRDTRSKVHTTDEWRGHKAILLFFVRSDCAVSNSYVPEMNRIAKTYSGHGVLTLAVLADSDMPLASAAKYAGEYEFSFPVILDPRQDLVRLAGATVTPQAVILSSRGEVFYRGRIDNRVEDAHYNVTDSISVPEDADLIGIAPHAHLLCKEMKIDARLPGGATEQLIWIRDWDSTGKANIGMQCRFTCRRVHELQCDTFTTTHRRIRTIRPRP